LKAEQIRRAVEEAIASIAPEVDVRQIRPGEPLRGQIGLDSMDWLNFVVALHERLAIEIPEADYGRVATLDSLVAYLARRRPRSRKAPRR
jgi:acyl carrier protein